MAIICVFLLLLSFSLSVNCGEYITACKAAGPIYVQYTYVISINSRGYANKIIQEEHQYTTSDCSGKPYLSFKTVLKASSYPYGTSSYDDYDLHYKSVEMTVEDKSTFESLGFTCQQDVKEGKSISLSKNECRQAGILYTKVYADSIGTTVHNARITTIGDTIRIMGLTATYSSMRGCTDQIILIVTICVIVVAIIVSSVICYCKKRK